MTQTKPATQDATEMSFDAPEPVMLSPMQVMSDLGLQLPVLDADQKAQLAASREPFAVYSCALMHGKFTDEDLNPDGLYWLLDIRLLRNDHKAVLFMGWKPDTETCKLESFYQWLNGQTVGNGREVGPFELEYVQWEGGNPFYTLRAR